MRWCRFGGDFFVCDCEKLKMYWMYIEFFGKKQAGKDVPKMWRRINRRFLNSIVAHSPSVSFADSSLPEGAYECACASLGGWALPDAFVIQRRNWHRRAGACSRRSQRYGIHLIWKDCRATAIIARRPICIFIG